MNTGLIFAILAAVTWGAVYAMDQKVMETLSPHLTLALQALFNLLIMLPFVIQGWSADQAGLGEVLQKKSVLAPLLVSLLLSGAAGILILYSIKHVGATNAAIIEISYPFFVAIFSFLIFGEKVNTQTVLGGLFILFGTWIVSHGMESRVSKDTAGISGKAVPVLVMTLEKPIAPGSNAPSPECCKEAA